MQLTFEIRNSGESCAGLNSYTDKVVVIIESGCPGGDRGEFEEYMRQAIADWFDGASVRNVNCAQDFLSQAMNEGDGVYRP